MYHLSLFHHHACFSGKNISTENVEGHCSMKAYFFKGHLKTLTIIFWYFVSKAKTRRDTITPFIRQKKIERKYKRNWNIFLQIIHIDIDIHFTFNVYVSIKLEKGLQNVSYCIFYRPFVSFIFDHYAVWCFTLCVWFYVTTDIWNKRPFLMIEKGNLIFHHRYNLSIWN